MGGVRPPYPRGGVPKERAPPTSWLGLEPCGCCCRRRIERVALAVARVRAWVAARGRAPLWLGLEPVVPVADVAKDRLGLSCSHLRLVSLFLRLLVGGGL